MLDPFAMENRTKSVKRATVRVEGRLVTPTWRRFNELSISVTLYATLEVAVVGVKLVDKDIFTERVAKPSVFALTI